MSGELNGIREWYTIACTESRGFCDNAPVSKAYVPVRQDPEKMRFIEWLTTPPAARQPATEAEFARMIDVHVKTLYNWKHDREFRETWQGETDQIIGDLDKRQRVLDALFEAASDARNPRHVSAAKLYLEAIREMSPERESQGKAIGLLTDAELALMIDRNLAEST
jgi:Helix-turn-helix of insertion element transposase